MNRPLVIAHRGGATVAAENTLAAFQSAIALGADGIELDLQLAGDSDLLVRHDLVDDQADYPPGPGLADILALVAAGRPDMTIVVDLKATPWDSGDQDRGARLVDTAAPLLAAYPRPDRIVLGSFDWGALEHAHATLPRHRTAFHTMAAHWLDGLPPEATGVADRRDLLAYLEDWRQRRGPGALARSPLDLIKAAGGAIWSCLHRDLTHEGARKARALGLAVWTWTVNTEADLARVLDIGVDAITSDRPDLVLEYLHRQPWEPSNDHV